MVVTKVMVLALETAVNGPVAIREAERFADLQPGTIDRSWIMAQNIQRHRCRHARVTETLVAVLIDTSINIGLETKRSIGGHATM